MFFISLKTYLKFSYLKISKSTIFVDFFFLIKKMKRAYGYKFVCLRVQLVILRKLGVVELVAAAVLPRRRH